MDLLILGGTGFLGRYLVKTALGDGLRSSTGGSASQGCSLSETMEDVLDWDSATRAGREPAAGLKPEREQELLRAWHGVTL
jgi:hypothetical protein